MRRYLSALALVFAVALGFTASQSPVNAAGVATAVTTKASAEVSAVEQVRYRHRHHPRIYFGYGYPKYYGYYGRPRHYYRKRHYRPYYYKRHHHRHHHYRRHRHH